MYPCFVLASLTYKSDTIQAQLAARQTRAAVAHPAASSASPPSVTSGNTPIQNPIAVSSPGASKEVQEEEKLHEEKMQKELTPEKATVAGSGGRDDEQEVQEPRPEVQHETKGAESKKPGNKKGKGNTAGTALSNGAQV